MAYNELIKSFDRLREYLREFYVYGFKRRSEFDVKSARTYDDEKRRIESFLGGYMRFRNTAEGKSVFLSIDSRVSRHNPLYNVWKAGSFTDGDITLHFILMDVLASHEKGISFAKLVDEVDGMLAGTERLPDESTVRKKLKEYVSEGIVRVEKRGKSAVYYPEKVVDVSPYTDVLDFYSETAPCGVIGSFLLDKCGAHRECFAFKHHYITNAIDSGIVCSLFEAMSAKRSVLMETLNRQKKIVTESDVVPLRIMISVQNGRQYLMGYVTGSASVAAFRVDNIISVKIGEKAEGFDEYAKELDEIRLHSWGVSGKGKVGSLKHVEFTVKYGEGEGYIAQRLEREKRCGTLERIDKNTVRFSADVYDAKELMPWIRTFICRIVDIRFSDRSLERKFFADLNEMYELYGIGEGGDDLAVQ